MIENYPFREDEYNADSYRGLFPAEIESDPWIAFHGTSGSNEDRIETEGLKWTNTTVSGAEIQEVVSIFERLRWRGKTMDGNPVLKSWSLKQMTSHKNKPVFLAKESNRAMLYATRSFAGGETLFSLRYAFADLKKYVNDKDFRERLVVAQRNQDPIDEYKAPYEPFEAHADWLAAALDRLSDLSRRACEPYIFFSHGVVYAVRFSVHDIETMEYSGPQGLRVHQHILVDSIVGKVEIPRGVHYDLAFRNTTRSNTSAAQEIIKRIRARDND